MAGTSASRAGWMFRDAACTDAICANSRRCKFSAVYVHSRVCAFSNMRQHRSSSFCSDTRVERDGIEFAFRRRWARLRIWCIRQAAQRAGSFFFHERYRSSGE